MAPPRFGAVALGVIALCSCSVEDDGLRRELGKAPMSSAMPASRPPINLPGDGAIDASPSPTALDPPPAVLDAAAAAIDTAPADSGAQLRALGQACGQAAECGSGHCADGVCCASACPGICEYCALDGARGQCAPVTGAPRGGRPACMGMGGPLCGGSCDGKEGSRCRYPGPETECAAATCTANVARTRGTCTGTGVCSRRLEVECMGSGCSGSICGGGCSPDAPCGPGRYCAGGRCFTRQANGTACASGDQCASASCQDRFCCARESCGVCESCTGPGGTCVRQPPGVDPDSCTDGRTCTPDGTCQ